MKIKVSVVKTLMGAIFFGIGLKCLVTKVVQVKPPTSEIKRDPFEKVDTFLRQQMAQLNIPGAVLTVVEKDQIVHSRCYGLARPGGEKLSLQTPFFIGSVTKSFTALAVMQLVEAGKVDLDAPVKQYLPWFRVADLKVTEQLRVRHLLNQTSSLSNAVGDFPLADMDPRPDANERQMRHLATFKPKRAAGEKYEYSNANFNLLGLIIEAISGECYADYIQTHILNPLKMTHSYTSKAQAKNDGLAVGHRFMFWNPIPMRRLPTPTGSLSSGQLICSAEDLSKFLIAHLNGGIFENQQILSGKGMDELHHGSAVIAEMGMDIGKYAMGWIESNSGPIKTVWHTGNVPDFSAYISMIPEQQKGVVLLVNAGHFMMTPMMGELGSMVSDLVAGYAPKPGLIPFTRLAPWLTRGLLLIPLLQYLGVKSTLGMLKRWKRSPQEIPSRGKLWGRHILLPMIPNLALIGSLIKLLTSGLYGFLNLFFPDFVRITLLSGTFAVFWTVLRIGLIQKAGQTK